jgi:hypothetical protein
LPLLKRKLDHEHHHSNFCDALQDDPEKILNDLLADSDMTPVVETDADVFAGLDFYFPDALSNKVTAPPAQSDKVTDEPAKPLSNKVTGRSRHQDKKDSQTLRTIQKTFITRGLPIDRPLVDVWFNPLPTYIKQSNDNVQLPVWDHSADRLKLTFANQGLVSLGGTHNDVGAFSLNLTPERIAEAQRHPKGFVTSLKLDLDRTFNRLIGEVPLYWFGAGATPDGRLHLHGAIHVNKRMGGVYREALLAIGGEWPEGNGEKYQLDIRPMTNPDGWVRYVLKQGPGARRLIVTGKSLTIPRELRLEGHRLYDELRSA